VRQKKNT